MLSYLPSYFGFLTPARVATNDNQNKEKSPKNKKSSKARRKVQQDTMQKNTTQKNTIQKDTMKKNETQSDEVPEEVNEEVPAEEQEMEQDEVQDEPKKAKKKKKAKKQKQLPPPPPPFDPTITLKKPYGTPPLGTVYVFLKSEDEEDDSRKFVWHCQSKPKFTMYSPKANTQLTNKKVALAHGNGEREVTLDFTDESVLRTLLHWIDNKVDINNPIKLTVDILGEEPTLEEIVKLHHAAFVLGTLRDLRGDEVHETIWNAIRPERPYIPGQILMILKWCGWNSAIRTQIIKKYAWHGGQKLLSEEEVDEVLTYMIEHGMLEEAVKIEEEMKAKKKSSGRD